MAATNDALDALNEIHGARKPDDVGIAEWIWGALQGDFNAERSTGQIGFDMVVSLIPVVDTLCDLRDLCANIRQYRRDPANKITLFFIATTVVGFIPELGTVVKSVLRLVWVYIKPLAKHADDITNASKLTTAVTRACDQALPKITEYLEHKRVVMWATEGKLPDVYKFVSKTILLAAAKVNPGLLARLIDAKFDDLKSLLKKIRPLVPAATQEHLDDLLSFVGAKCQTMSSAIQEFAHPIRTVLSIVAKRLDDQAWHVEIRRTNHAWVAISESGTAKLTNAEPKKWADKLSGPMKHPPLDPADRAVKALMMMNPTHPRIDDATIATFARTGGGMRADLITGPAKLYRIIDPSNEAAGIFWISEAEFKSIKNRDDWRSGSAVKPHWNGNGHAVTYALKAGETQAVWRGPSASQMLDGTDCYLKGGREQIVFFPGQRDEMVNARPRIDPQTGAVLKDSAGNDDRRVEFYDVTGEMVATKLRGRIKDPHISAPFKTGWGETDYLPEEAKRILLTVPTPP